jgi:PQQ-dependent dehydrogenase (methanol/ethanol family)
MHARNPVLAALIVLIIPLGIAGCQKPAPGAAATPSAAGEWRRIGNDDFDRHFSPLRSINDTNAAQLKLEWYADMPVRDGLVGVPLVADGVVYQSGPLGLVFANDLRTGKPLWTFDAGIKFPLGIIPAWGARLSRGLALWEDKVIRATGDCRLIALDRRSGTKLWEARACDPNEFKTITGAPRVGDGKVFIGNANADSGVGRGYVDAYDVNTGARLWRFFTIPGDPAAGFENAAMEKASKTWGKEYWKKVGGGSVWEAMTYDPRTDLLIFGTDGAVPLSPLDRGEGAGDELFTNAVVAVRADTGEYVWHYSTTPGDGWNYSATMPFVLSDMEVDGKSTPVVMTAPKNGFFYVFDARTGKLVNQPKAFTTVNWASHIDMTTGRPVKLPGAEWWKKGPEGAVVFPYGLGAHNWMPMAFSPDTGLVYIPAADAATRYFADPRVLVGRVDVDNYHSRDHGGPFKGKLVAWDPVTQTARWERDIGAPYQGGTLATAGNVVFQGTSEGRFVAYRADTGDVLWSFDAGAGILGAPSTVEVDGKQMILVATGSGTTSAVGFAPLIGGNVGGPARLLAFSLEGAASLPPANVAPEPFPEPPAPRPDAKLVAAGKVVWDTSGCELCHGVRAIGGPGSVPDLRRINSARLELFPMIVRGGLFTPSGMPEFKDYVSEADLPGLQAYIVEQAWIAYDAQQKASAR